MKPVLFVDFADQRALMAGLEAAHRSGVGIVDAFTPYPIEGLGEALGGNAGARRVRIFMLVGGLAAAAFAYALQFYSAVFAYPFDSGGRPPNSWPVFMLFPFEFGVLAAAVFGLVGLFLWTGLPRLDHPLFDVEGFERASNDRFILAISMPSSGRRRDGLEKTLRQVGALAIREAEL